ncbi:ABC transporter substrate-binding protein [Actinomadura sp. SCN-SB]|uniref:ABC transporter substrate-binding protein n=1 Tax=Actinomadura sp. SCN-SB TaxID=3373092 RepID=UPI003752083E
MSAEVGGRRGGTVTGRAAAHGEGGELESLDEGSVEYGGDRGGASGRPAIGGSERLDRRRLLGAGIGAGAALALGCGATALARTTAARPGGRALRIGYLPITDASPLLIAHARGLYERFGVRVERPVRFRAWAELAQALVADRVDFVHLLMPFAIQLRYGMMPSLRVVAWNHTGGRRPRLPDRHRPGGRPR